MRAAEVGSPSEIVVVELTHQLRRWDTCLTSASPRETSASSLFVKSSRSRRLTGGPLLGTTTSNRVEGLGDDGRASSRGYRLPRSRAIACAPPWIFRNGDVMRWLAEGREAGQPYAARTCR